MCGRVEHFVAAAGHGAVAGWLLTGALPVSVQASMSGPARAAVAVLAAAGTIPMSGGKYSPDIDQFGVWKRWDRRLPDEWLGWGGPLRHRGITHWWGLPGAATGAVWWACHRMPLPAAVLLLLVAWMPLAGVWSHLLSDYWIGARYLGGKRAEADDPTGDWRRKSMLDSDDSPRGPGIPLLPWTLHIGAGWRVGSVQEWLYVMAMVAAGAGAVWAAWRGVSVAVPWPVWAAIGAGMLAIGFAGRRGFAAAVQRAKRRALS